MTDKRRAGTKLHEAVNAGSLDSVKSLIASGADINEGDRMGCPPLLSAVLEGHEEMARMLVASGADVNAGNHRFAITSPGP